MGSKLCHDSRYRDRQGAFERATAGACVSAPAELFSNRSDIELSLAAQAHAVSSIGKLTEKCRDLDILNGERIIHQPFTVFFLGYKALHLVTRDPNPGQRPFAMQC